MSAIDKDILDTMTDEEREILNSDEWKDDQEQAAKRPDLHEGDEEVEEADDEDDAADEADEADEAPAPAAVVDAPAAEVEEATVVETRKAVYRAELPADYDAKVKALADEDAGLAAKFKTGEIDFDEFRALSTELNNKRHDLSMAKVKAEIAAEMGEQTAESTWQETIDSFMAKSLKDEGIDYRKDKPKEKDLDLFVKALAADEEYADKPMAWFLTEAHRMVRAKHGIQAPAVVKPGKTTRPAPVDQIPKTLAGVPGTDGPGDMGGDEFQDLDRLEGLELEDAVAKLSPAAREKYLSA
jgi:hypothetical protein